MDSENSTQKMFLRQQYFSHLESIEGQNYHAMTDDNGMFTIPLDCLAFGLEQFLLDEFGNILDENWQIPHRAQLWIIHDDYQTFHTEWYDVDPNSGIELIPAFTASNIPSTTYKGLCHSIKCSLKITSLFEAIAFLYL